MGNLGDEESREVGRNSRLAKVKRRIDSKTRYSKVPIETIP